MMYTTLNKIRQHSPCTDGWVKLLKHQDKTEADDEPLSFLTILESNGLDDAIWCCRAAPEYDKEWRLFAVWCARQVQHLMTDERSVAALDVAERYANGLATKEELDAATVAAYATYSYNAADDAAVSAAWGDIYAAANAVSAARAAANAAYSAARAAANAAYSAARDADAAYSAARDADAAVRVATGTATAGIFDLDVDSNGRWSVKKFKGLLFQFERETSAVRAARAAASAAASAAYSAARDAQKEQFIKVITDIQ